MKWTPKWSIATIALTAVAAAASASPAAASVTIGQIGTPDTSCSNGDWSQPTVGSGNSYVVPATGGITNWTLTSWSHTAKAAAGQKLKVKVFRPVAGLTYTVVGQDISRDLPAGGGLSTFLTSIAVKPGDVLGMTVLAGSPGCGFGPAADMFYISPGTDQPNGTSVTFEAFPGKRLNISAVVEPVNTFTLGAITRNKKKGTATLTVNVPNPGELSASGKGVKGASAAGAVISKTVATAGTVKLVIKAKGKQKKKLKKKGKVGLKAKVTFTPTGGDAATQTKKLKLKRKLKRKKR